MQPDIMLGYSVHQLTQVAPFKKTKIYELIKDGTLETTKVGGRRVINAKSVQRLMGWAA